MLKFMCPARRPLFCLLFIVTFSASSIARAAGEIPDSFRKDALQEADQGVKDSAVSPVPMDISKQPGYVRGTSAGYGNYAGGWDNYSTFQFEETRAQLGLGGAYLISNGDSVLDGLVAVRYRLSPAVWPVSDERPWHLGPLPLSLHIEAGAFPGGNTTVQSLALYPNANSSLSTTLKFNYQLYLALVDELPHGRQNWVVPEIAAGVGYSETVVSYLSSRYTVYTNPFGYIFDGSVYDRGQRTERAWAPYMAGGLHFFADHFVSVLLNASYIKYPYNNSLVIAPSAITDSVSSLNFPGYQQALNFPTHAWAVQARLQIKLAWPTLVHTPLLPQMMPPWLLSAYSTDEISPWVASPETQQKYNEPGKPSVGNVFFQYKNRDARRVELIADFNDWTPERMVRDRSGMWVTVKDLPAGKFRYNYVIDGHREILDPWNKNVDPASRAHGSSLVKIQTTKTGQ